MELRNPPDLGELGGVRSQRGRRRHQHLEVLLQVGRDQLQVRLAQRLELKLRMSFSFGLNLGYRARAFSNLKSSTVHAIYK